jgi:hypothetical protein
MFGKLRLGWIEETRKKPKKMWGLLQKKKGVKPSKLASPCLSCVRRSKVVQHAEFVRKSRMRS